MKNQTPSPLLTSIVISSRYLSVWIAIGLLILRRFGLRMDATVLSCTTVMPLPLPGAAALGQRLVVMTVGSIYPCPHETLARSWL